MPSGWVTDRDLSQTRRSPYDLAHFTASPARPNEVPGPTAQQPNLRRSASRTRHEQRRPLAVEPGGIITVDLAPSCQHRTLALGRPRRMRAGSRAMPTAAASIRSMRRWPAPAAHRLCRQSDEARE